MQKLVIDTNVFVSYLISEKGHCFKIVNEFLLAKRVLNCLSYATLNEYRIVFSRTRFSKKYPSFHEKSKLLLDSLIKFSEIAYTANADYLITGSRLDFTFLSFHNTHIVSPREYWENYKPQN